jgi:hypothetical protein
MTSKTKRSICIFYVTVWLLLASQQLYQIYSQVINHEYLYDIVNEAIVANFWLGVFGLILTRFTLLGENIGTYLISIFIIGASIAGGISYLDELEPSSGAQSHMNSYTNLFLWLIAMAIVSGIVGIIEVFKKLKIK